MKSVKIEHAINAKKAYDHCNSTRKKNMQSVEKNMQSEQKDHGISAKGMCNQ